MCTLRVRFSQSSERRGVFNYALKVEVSRAVGIPSKIFVYHQSPAGLEGNTFAEFDHIATPVDFQEIPEDAASETVPWYRTDKCTVWFRNVSDLELAKQLFVDDINALVRTFDVLTSENGFSRQTSVEFSENGVYSTDVPEEDTIQKEIDEMKKDISGKISKDAMSGVKLETNTAEGIRSAVQEIGNTLGARIVKTVVLALSVLSIGASALGAGFSGEHVNQIDYDENPIIVTNVTFDGLATLVDITNLIDHISTNFVPALQKEIADASEAGTNYVASATNSVLSVVDAAMDDKLDSTSAAPKFDETRTAQTKYEHNELVSKDGVVYQCTNASGHYGAWDPDNWTAKPVSELYKFESGPTGTWACTPAATQFGTPFSVKWTTDPAEGEGWALFTGGTKQGMVLGDEGSTELSWSPAAQTSGYTVSAVRQFSGTEYHLKGQPEVKLQPAGDYVPASRTVNGQPLSSNVTLTGADIAVSGTNDTKISVALAGKASKADATLTERGGWNIVNTPLTPEQKAAFLAESEAASSNDYAVTIRGGSSHSLYVGEYYAAGLSLSADGLSLSYYVGSSEANRVWGPSGTTVATLDDSQGYLLGPDDPSNPNRDKPIASEAEAEALRDGKLDKADVVAPSTSASDSGKAADAKATGDELAGKRDYDDLSYKVTDRPKAWPFGITEWRYDFNGDPTVVLQKDDVHQDWRYDTGGQYGYAIVSGSYDDGKWIFQYSVGGSVYHTWESDGVSCDTSFVPGGQSLHAYLSATPSTYGKDTTLALTAEPNHTGNLAALDAQGNPTDSGVAKSDVETLFFAQYYPEGNVKSAAEFTVGIKYDDPDEVHRTITVKPFCNTGNMDNDNSSLRGRVVIPPFVDIRGNGYISDDGTRFKVVGVSGGIVNGENANLTAVVAPNTVTTIGDSAFYYCEALTSVSLPAATGIVGAAFGYCKALTSVSLPATKGFGDGAFTSCTALTDLSLPDATDIGWYAFSDCTSLASIDFGDNPRSGVPSLGGNAFINVPTTCQIIVPYTQYDEWIAADGWEDLPQEFVRHAEKADRPATFTTGNLAEFDANGNPIDSGIAKTNVLTFVYDVNSNRTAVTVGVPRRNDPNFEADTPVIDETTVEFVTVPAVVGSHSVAITGDGESSSSEATVASGEGSFALNHGAATNRFSVALGKNTFAAGVAAISHGEMTAALGDYSHSEGYETRAYGDYSHAEGDGAIAFGFGAHAEGYCNEARGAYSHVEGAFAQTSASAWYAHSSGVSASATNHTAYVWQGATYDNGNPDHPNIGVGGNYYSHGLGTYNVNPNGGLAGFWVGETNLAQHVANLTAGKLDKSGGTVANLTIKTSASIDVEFSGRDIEIYSTRGDEPETLAVLEFPEVPTFTHRATLALAAPYSTEDNLAALDANGNPVDSDIAKTDVLTKSRLSGETMPANPTQNELAEAVKKIFTALGGTVTP